MIAQTPFNLITSSADMAKMYSERDGVPGDDGRDLREIGWKPMKSTQYYSPLPDLASLNGRLRDERRSADVPRRFTRTTPPVSVTFVLKNRRILPLNYCLVDFSKPETNIAKPWGSHSGQKVNETSTPTNNATPKITSPSQRHTRNLGKAQLAARASRYRLVVSRGVGPA